MLCHHSSAFLFQRTTLQYPSLESYWISCSPSRNELFDKLKKIYSGILKHDLIMTIGDFNAQLGKENREVADGLTVHEESNDNGEQLCNFAAATDMFKVSTKCKHKNIHKVTWMQPCRNGGDWIDEMLTRKKNLKSINDMRSYRGPNFIVIAE
ncbi:hypothetical protein ILUMI_19414 [Ignelater luminosus]|uniref:Craniofacial development protein 2-like n=1 Tax=Ignelater luminosus TaxID=2038154 RepID=A0A8K0CI87_IGNLU|nr:hypothetical protein ILUMI_19414 [Ignelater luminosus]